DLGVIPPALFAMLVIMALVTTFMTTPLLARVYSPEEQERMIAEEGGEEDDDEEEGPWRVLVPLAKLDNAYELVHNALSLVPGTDRDVQVILLRVLTPPSGFIRLNPYRQQALVD